MILHTIYGPTNTLTGEIRPNTRPIDLKPLRRAPKGWKTKRVGQPRYNMLYLRRQDKETLFIVGLLGLVTSALMIFV